MQAFCLVLAVFLAFIIPQIDVYVQWCNAFGVGQETLVIVQPALSKSAYMPDKIKEVLASASYYISKAGKVRGLEILGSS